MASNLNLSFGVDGVLENALDLSTLKDPLTFPSTWEPLNFSFAAGVADGQIDRWWHDKRTLAAATAESLDLRGGTVSDPLALKLDFAKIKVCVISIDTPTNAKRLYIGPNNVANAFQGWFGAVTAGVYEEFYHSLAKIHPYAGWSVTAGTGDLLVIENPTGSEIAYQIFLAGLKP